MSETQGLGQLEARRNTFTNIPEPTGNYVPREQLERDLKDQLTDTDRHFIVTLTGRGGIGKTSTALQAISALIESGECPYDVVIWFSARDVDLLDTGPKAVRPHAISIADFAREYAGLLEPGEMHSKGFKPQSYFGDQLSGATIGPTLFVFDNFETTSSPVEVYGWLDTFIRRPNKILITSRDRRFTGDYVLPVQGMTHSESEQLISSTATFLGIEKKLNTPLIESLIQESDGHPYIIKLMLGEIVRSGVTSPERIMAGHNEALAALFERSYHRLSSAAQRVFLTMCNWKSSVPSLVLEAVLMRPENEKMDVQSALEELIQSSFIEEIIDDVSTESEISVPLAARLFGLQKFEVSVWRPSIEKDTSILFLLGAQTHGHATSLALRVQRFFNNVADALAKETRTFADIQPVLDFITSRHSHGAVLLADLIREFGYGDDEEERYLLKYVEGPDSLEHPAWSVWLRIADIRRRRRDASGELHALVQVCRRNGTPARILSNTANRINGTLKERPAQFAREEKEYLIVDVVDALEQCGDDLDATDLSRLAWLQLHLDHEDSALRTVQKGLRLEPYNEHCQRLEARLRRH